MTILKHTLTRLLCLLLCAALLCPIVLAEEISYTGDILVAVNTDLSEYSLSEGGFSSSVQPGAMCSQQTISNIPLPANAVDIRLDPENGQALIQVEPPRTTLQPISVRRDDQASLQALTSQYTIGSTASSRDVDQAANVSMSCVYIGQYCTVWTCTSDPESIRIDATSAKTLATEFDAHCQEMVDSFGNWEDVDRDGKLAIFCYDIGGTYSLDSYREYTAGLFDSQDMIGADGYIGQFNFGKDNYICGMDTIHMDTFPTMGRNKATPFDDMENAYSTLFHEMQHLIEFSYQVNAKSYDHYDQLSVPTYLNEAFSMAAEHLICGADACQSRIQYYNYDSYWDGSALTYWAFGLSNYTNSYLFGQYLRTRYGQKTNTDGSTLFKTVLSSTTRTSDTLAYIAGLLDTTPQTLISDFWKAVYLQEKKGPYGFAGEAWIEALEPHVYNVGMTNKGIYNGGAIFYALDGNTVTPKDPVSLEFHAIRRGNGVTVNLPTSESAAVVVRSNSPGQLFFAVYAPSGQYLGCYARPVAGTGSAEPILISGISQDLSQCHWKALVISETYHPLCFTQSIN